jgi:hypothetical protein
VAAGSLPAAFSSVFLHCEGIHRDLPDVRGKLPRTAGGPPAFPQKEISRATAHKF